MAATTPPGAGSEALQNPLLKMALSYLVKVDPLTRQQWADAVCESLGVRPRFWLLEKDGDVPPTNTLCAVKVGNPRDGVRVVLGTHDGAAWRAVADGAPLAEVQAFGFIPD